MNRSRSIFHRHALAAAVMLALAGGTAHAQLSTSTIKGRVSSGAAAAQSGLAVTAVNQANGNTYRTSTLSDGSYVLTGLAPGDYEIRVGDRRSSVVTLQVGETAAVDLSLTVQQITIVGNAQRQGVRDSQVGTNVSRRLIEALPQSSHNFLSSADLAPGVAFSTDGSGFTKLQSGAQNFDHINVFIDGVGQKNNILRGGVSGQDTSRGNPFPQSAIAEFKILTQNYKAEFEQVSSAAITAITRSGTNEFHSEGYVDRTGTNWRSKTKFEKEKEAQGVDLPPSSKYEFGTSVGGPILQDKLHFFIAYDGKKINDSRVVVPREVDKLPAGLGVVPDIVAAQGSEVNRFTEHLVFGKLDSQLNEDQHLSLSFKLRREDDRVAENRDLSAPGNNKERSNDDTRIDLKHEWISGALLSEARVGYANARWYPHSDSDSPFIKYKVSTATPPLISASQDVLFIGGSPDAQNRQEKSTFFSEDLTYTGLKGHVFKGGAKVKALKFDLSGTANSVDTIETLVDTTTGLTFFSGSNCTGTNITNGGANSDQCKINRALPGATAKYKNTQIGLYLQDDWAVTPQLEFNLGLRYDYETNMLNNNFVTPADRVAALQGLDGRTFGPIVAPAGQTYAESLALGGINIDDYISTGNSRKAYKKAFAPRLGASYDLLGDRNSVLFGGWGRSFDRTMANHALDELQKNQQAGGEIWLIRNKFKMPFADQFSLGLRQGLGQWNAEITLSRIEAKNQFSWFGGNRDPQGGFATQSPIDPLWGGPNGFGTLILGDFVTKAKTNSVFGKLEKPYTRDSGWSANFAYTYSDAKTTNRDWNNDIFDWTYGRPGVRGFNRSVLVEKHRLVAAGMIDKGVPLGLAFSAKAIWSSGNPRRIVSCAAGFSDCVAVPLGSPSFTQIDLSVSREIAVMGAALNFRVDILNAFNTTNFGGFDDWGGGPVAPGNPTNAVGGDNLNLSKPNATRGDPRTFRAALSYKF